MAYRQTYDSMDEMRGTSADGTAYAAGWTISGIVTLGTILAVWIFAV